MKYLREEKPPTNPETGAKEIDEDFFRKYKKLHKTREFRNRDE